MDQRGHGRSGRPAHNNLSLRALGRDIGTVLDVVAPDRPVVVIGHSMGGMAAMALAEQRPELFGERVVGLILIGTSADDLLRGAMGSIRSCSGHGSAPCPPRRAGSTGSGRRSWRAPGTSGEPPSG